MILIPPDKVDEAVNSSWRTLANEATTELLAAEPEARQAIIESKGAIWRDLKPALAGVSYEKCWYCEARENRSDNAVDHFRPKGRVAENLDHGGYWWLAFRLANLRFSCTFCNSRRRGIEGASGGGKHDRFPLANESNRASGPTDDLGSEEPLLLDPCRPEDVALLWFDESGETRINPTLDSEETEKRVNTSREVYHLDHPKIVFTRRRIHYEVTQLVEKIDRYFEAYSQDTPGAREMFGEVVNQLRRMISDDALHSRTARCALRSLAPTSGAAQELFEAIR